jgi:hypothetical protein
MSRKDNMKNLNLHTEEEEDDDEDDEDDNTVINNKDDKDISREDYLNADLDTVIIKTYKDNSTDTNSSTKSSKPIPTNNHRKKKPSATTTTSTAGPIDPIDKNSSVPNNPDRMSDANNNNNKNNHHRINDDDMIKENNSDYSSSLSRRGDRSSNQPSRDYGYNYKKGTRGAYSSDRDFSYSHSSSSSSNSPHPPSSYRSRDPYPTKSYHHHHHHNNKYNNNSHQSQQLEPHPQYSDNNDAFRHHSPPRANLPSQSPSSSSSTIVSSQYPFLPSSSSSLPSLLTSQHHHHNHHHQHQQHQQPQHVILNSAIRPTVSSVIVREPTNSNTTNNNNNNNTNHPDDIFNKKFVVQASPINNNNNNNNNNHSTLPSSTFPTMMTTSQPPPPLRGMNALRRLEPFLETKEGTILKNNSVSKTIIQNVTRVTLLYDNILHDLVNLIETHQRDICRGNLCIIGCMAWLSHPGVIEALSKCLGISILVNDEDYSFWGRGVAKRLYHTLPKFQQPFHMVFRGVNTPLAHLEKENNGSSSFAAVRMIGNGRLPDPEGETKYGFKRGNLMHTKYLVFCEWDYQNGGQFRPYALWTGSINTTTKAQFNMENAQFFEDANVAQSFFNNYAEAFLSSTSLTFGTFNQQKHYTHYPNNQQHHNNNNNNNTHVNYNSESQRFEANAHRKQHNNPSYNHHHHHHHQ